MLRGRSSLPTILILIFIVLSLTVTGFAQEPVIRMVLFFSPTCPHCLTVIDEGLPPLVDKYGSQLVVYAFNTYTKAGSEAYDAAVDAFDIPPESQVVPLLIVGNQILSGGYEIPEKLPGIIEDGLAQGGIDWPAIPNLEQYMLDYETISDDLPSTSTPTSTFWDKFKGDLQGNIIAVLVLLGMIGAVVITGFNLQKDTPAIQKNYHWLIPILSVIGIAVAGYLSFVEYKQIDAVCGPVGNCNAVQESSYATLFGVLPVGFLGMLGYLAVIILWLISSLDMPTWRRRAVVLLWVVTLIGTLFSIYLTFLEPFVIGATCMWCITSAIVMTILFLLSSNKYKTSL